MPEPVPADRIPAKSDAQAKGRLLDILQRSLTTVHANAIWLVAPVLHEPGQWAAITEPRAVPVWNSTHTERLYFRSTIRFHYGDHPKYSGERKANTDFYAHTVAREEDMSRQLYSWEWDPTAWSWPHVHVDRAAGGPLGKLHIPTGRVFFENMLIFLIEEHGTQPARTDWKHVLGETLRRVSSFSTWGGLNA